MKTKLHLKFPAELTGSPITYDLIKKFDLKLNILKAEIDYNLVGNILFEIDGKSSNIASAIEYLENRNIESDLIPTTILIDKEKCNECGLCTSVCKIKALSISPPNWNLEFNSNKCVGCNHCIEVCPTRAISNFYFPENY
ncbi:NIL domain-containing protein [Helicovermis profundi]|uniref:NIL domain-containing protein n=1 Tax=Helicovermis profundi TaxID=3065157 RepID=A0AAU9ET62_9FIRM|nr:NIL domain-containing protein [Clostridia bacterium S502]